MPAPHPPEFGRRAGELAGEKTAPVAQIARERGVSEWCLRNWRARAGVGEGTKGGLASGERQELARLRPPQPPRPGNRGKLKEAFVLVDPADDRLCV